MGLPDPHDVAAYETALGEVTVGPVEPLAGCVALFEHRLLKAAGGAVNLHVFSAGCTETDRMVRFRDHLRCNVADRDLYARTKRDLAARDWKYMQQYADAKTAVIGEIMARAAPPP
jgi:GrpB-like predicted nucleotidyltransferase (UPF0157 family)